MIPREKNRDINITCIEITIHYVKRKVFITVLMFKFLPLQGAVGVDARPCSRPSLNSPACFTSKRSRRRVAMTMTSSLLWLLLWLFRSSLGSSSSMGTWWSKHQEIVSICILKICAINAQTLEEEFWPARHWVWGRWNTLCRRPGTGWRFGQPLSSTPQSAHRPQCPPPQTATDRQSTAVGRSHLPSRPPHPLHSARPCLHPAETQWQMNTQNENYCHPTLQMN